jgi:hypothetical protein
MYNKEPQSVFDIVDNFPTEQSCIDHLERLRWNGEVTSPFYENADVRFLNGNKYQCMKTGKFFNVKTNTAFHGTKIPLIRWFYAIHLLSKSPKLSLYSFGLYLGLNEENANFMMNRVKELNIN